MSLLEVENLSVDFRGDAGWTRAVSNVSFALQANASLGIVGESGSGKSVCALSILRLHHRRMSRMPQASIRFDGRDLLTLDDRELRRVRGSDIAMIFQDPMTSLNPVLTIADQIGETLRIHQGLDRAAARRRAIELLDMVRIPDAARRVDEYPHRLSGGMRQRVMIAMAIACRPRLLIADEPTTALDVTIQAQIMQLLRELQAEIGMSVILISHDLGLVAEFAQRVIVMYAGHIVEEAEAAGMFARPLHPYTEGLLRAIPKLDSAPGRLPAIPGNIPASGNWPAGCRFGPRCGLAEPACLSRPVPLETVDGDRRLRCPPRRASLEAGV
ncbi:ABC transporter ATP-binding protein [Bordetella hinzii]|uniref:ABC transporter ATP-binding protein n=1 Tax=Bordetella hinzii TaxID=103855 RepID=A0AAN1VH30_9BORD|nr:ABC transporter ATP-binding protein [Bordetella hinzii]AKQ60375.1 Oligopeptide transport ATP-binding protein OppD [Bordetella hinzii]AZW18566.1 ABC transporter ATP-binding protein [Bordetella hinzii]MBZ0077022.1 ABC transporter ATP-binding protein [Bordetella hinzii]MBZ0081641.1 ABC transporter ATP-binding protein [Bordetella hinzii]MBZ0085947.1 ABC transporter ATP-binding protein [Bordetella hinzii]